MDRKFPIYDHHEHSVDVSCFNCGDMYDKAIAVPSGYPKGRGAFFSECCKCHMKTYYDIREVTP